MFRLLAPAILTAVLLSSATPAAAQPQPTPEEVERARSHFNAGLAYFGDGRYEDAAREFEEAYRLTQHADMLYNLGQCYDRLERRGEAITTYRRYLSLVRESPDRGRVEIRIRELELIRHAEEPPLDDLSEAPAQPPPPPAASPPLDEPAGFRFGIVPVTIAFGVAGAAAIGATVTGALALSRFGDLEDTCDSGRRCPPEAQDDIDAGETLATLSTVFTLFAVASAAAGVTFLLLDSTADDDGEPTATVQLVPGPAPAGAGARVRF